MAIDRRKLLKDAATAAAVLPLASISSSNSLGGGMDTVESNAIVIDALANIGNPNVVYEGIAADSTPTGRWPEVDERAILDAHRSGLTAVNLTLGHVFGEGDDAPFEYTVQSIASYDAMIRAHADEFLKVHTGKDILHAKATGKVGLIYGFQNTLMLGDDAERVRIFSDLGVRVIQLSYNLRNRVGDGSMAKENAGLTEFGREVVNQLNDNKVLVDLSHSGEKLCLDAIAESKVPIAITHTACFGVTPHPRNKTDNELKRLADAGGVAGIYFMPYLKIGSQPYADDLIRHIEHAINICGEDHVGIGSDGSVSGIDNMENYKAMLKADVENRKKQGVAAPGETVDIVPFLPDLSDHEKYHSLAKKLSARGHSARRVDKILGGNFLRLMTDVWPG